MKHRHKENNVPIENLVKVGMRKREKMNMRIRLFIVRRFFQRITAVARDESDKGFIHDQASWLQKSIN